MKGVSVCESVARAERWGGSTILPPKLLSYYYYQTTVVVMQIWASLGSVVASVIRQVVGETESPGT